jgi:hypothetical protein
MRKAGLRQNDIVAFIDCTVRAIARPVIGQRAVHSGHQRKHALKYQALMLLDGLICGLYGQKQGRRNDNMMLNISGLLEDVLSLQTRLGVPYKLYGDPAYHCNQAIMTGFNRTQRRIDPMMDWYISVMNASTTSVE